MKLSVLVSLLYIHTYIYICLVFVAVDILNINDASTVRISSDTSYSISLVLFSTILTIPTAQYKHNGTISIIPSIGKYRHLYVSHWNQRQGDKGYDSSQFRALLR